MGENSKIAWTHHTFCPWWGCQKVSTGCLHCYAEVFAHRLGRECFGVWPRRPASEKYWHFPLRWNADALLAGERRRVFCSSMCDVFEVGTGLDASALDAWRERLWQVIRACTGLDWLLLTKRPENFARLLPAEPLPANVWLGVTVENQAAADYRIPLLLQAPAAVRFLSCEPLLETLDLSPWLVCHHGDALCAAGGDVCGPCGDELVGAAASINWVIVGGESGGRARPFDVRWARSISSQCREAGVAFFLKQLGARTHSGREPYVQRRPTHLEGHWLVDRDGRDPSEWPPDLRVQQFPFAPEVRR